MARGEWGAGISSGWRIVVRIAPGAALGGNLRFITKRGHGMPAIPAAKEPDQRRELLRKRHLNLFRDFSQHMVRLADRH